jgi:prepilin signal peptidase PulO-like enzyme (type II secretory pathway)
MMLVWPMMAIVFALNLLLGFSWMSLLFFGAIGTAFFLIQYLLTAKRGVGEGDIWIGALLGLAFPNAGHLFLIMLIAYVTGAAVGVVLMLMKKKGWRSRLALGPFLVLGAMTALLWGDRIIAWYLSLL